MKLSTVFKVVLGLVGLYVREPKKKDWREPEGNGQGFSDGGSGP